MAEKPRTFSKGEFIGGLVAALAVGFFLGSMFMEMRGAGQMPVQAGVSMPGQMPGQMPPQGADAHDHAAEFARIAELEMSLAKKSGDQAGWIELGNLYFDTHQARKSIASYEKAVALGPVSADVWTDLGIMHREAGEPKQAVETFDAALKLDPAHQNALYNKGVVLLHDLQDRAGAAAAWEALLKVNPSAKNPEGMPMRDMVQGLKKS
ncbi:MAG: tetratricopeptide repeat protein [Desulfovibrio sp.]|jgi:cytochrome c-type biogenesis protein CcmH/NrfG|nr:tetratricopeptide repeat protein [Desulfovibrio sp.]